MNQAKPVVRIIMVDDDKDDLFLTEICFRNASFPVEFTALKSAHELFDYIKDNGIGSFDVLLLDINMPVMGGLESLKALKQYPYSDELEIFMFSTSTRLKDKEACIAAGATGYINKPSGIDQMRAFVNDIGESISIRLDAPLKNQAMA